MYEDALRLYSRSLVCPIARSAASDTKWHSDEWEAKKKKLTRPSRDKLFHFVKTILSICLTIPLHKGFILRWWHLIKTILTLKLKCKICFFLQPSFFPFSFFKASAQVCQPPTCANFLLLFAPLLLLPHCPPPLSRISHPWHGRRGGDSECEILWLSKKDEEEEGKITPRLGPFSKHCERQREEHWTEKKRRREEEAVWARRGRAGVEEWGERKVKDKMPAH